MLTEAEKAWNNYLNESNPTMRAAKLATYYRLAGTSDEAGSGAGSEAGSGLVVEAFPSSGAGSTGGSNPGGGAYYWNLKAVFEEAWLGQEDTYTDFEGFTDGGPIKQRIYGDWNKWVENMFDEVPGLQPAVKDILVHLLYEEEEDRPSDDYVNGAATMLWYLMTNRRLMCVVQPNQAEAVQEQEQEGN